MLYVTGFSKTLLLYAETTYAHNDNAQFSLPINSIINKLTNHHLHTTKSKQVCFCWDYFLRHVRRTVVLGRMALKWLWWPLTIKQALGQRSANHWLLLLSIDLATFYDISSTTGLHLSPFGSLVDQVPVGTGRCPEIFGSILVLHGCTKYDFKYY